MLVMLPVEAQRKVNHVKALDDVTRNLHRHAAATAFTTVSLGGGDTHLLYQATLQ